MIEKICLDVNGTTEVKVGDNIINFKAPYKRVTMLGAIKEHTGYDLTGMNEEQIREVCKKLNMEIDDTMGKGKLDRLRSSVSSAKALIYSLHSSRITRSRCLL